MNYFLKLPCLNTPYHLKIILKTFSSILGLLPEISPHIPRLVPKTMGIIFPNPVNMKTSYTYPNTNKLRTNELNISPLENRLES